MSFLLIFFSDWSSVLPWKSSGEVLLFRRRLQPHWTVSSAKSTDDILFEITSSITSKICDFQKNRFFLGSLLCLQRHFFHRIKFLFFPKAVFPVQADGWIFGSFAFRFVQFLYSTATVRCVFRFFCVSSFFSFFSGPGNLGRSTLAHSLAR